VKAEHTAVPKLSQNSELSRNSSAIDFANSFGNLQIGRVRDREFLVPGCLKSRCASSCNA